MASLPAPGSLAATESTLSSEDFITVNDSPPDTPTSDRRVVTTPPQPLSPSPSASPTSQKKGHRPTIPLIPKERSLTSSPPPSKESPKNIKKIPPPPPSKPITEKEEEVETAPLPKQRPMPPKRPLKPRASSDAPVAVPRPVPAPRRTGGKEVTKSPLRELPEEIVEDGAQIVTVTSHSNIEPHVGNEPVESQKHNPEMMNELTEEERVHETTTESDIDTDSKKNAENENNRLSPTPPLHVEEINMPAKAETVHQRGVSEDNDPKSPNASSTDEYEPMMPGVTKDESRSCKGTPEYEEPEVWNLDSPALPIELDDGGYATPCPVPKKDEAAYDMPVPSTKVDLNVLSPTPQVPVLATVNEESLTAGRGKSPPLPCSSSGEGQLKPFRIERDALGYTKVVKQKQKSIDAPESDDEHAPPLWSGTEKRMMNDDVPSTLHQSREILRLAQVMKQEVEEMRREVQRELEMARRERQDAELLKKNAIEILRMAKEKLHQSPVT